MPTMANITVKAADGSSDILYTAMNPASGDGVKALWRALAVSTQPAAQPWLVLWSRNNGPGSARRVDYEYRYPQSYTTTTTGLISLANQFIWKGSIIVPQGAPTAFADENAAQCANLLASPLVKAAISSGFAPQ